MKIAERLERRLLGTARALCLLALVAVVMAITAVMFALAFPGKQSVIADPSVNVTDVLASLPGSEAANDAISGDSANGGMTDVNVQAAAGLVIPAPLRQVLNGDNASQPLLNAWLVNVPLPDRQQFLNKLSEVVAHASQHAATWEWDNRERYVAAAMNQYARVKIERIASAEGAIEAAHDRSEQFRTSLGTLLALVGFLTLLLVLLAIERNTRHLRVGRAD
ncbi:hypothetical protein LMG28688_05860 [Paraburkholderia caffeinitolerans]|uniref:Uncharacterized protein n=1 Tax=Paraburkholderia caffeinitolerans TaxID=1723730 RepID=A0A6J5GQL4_9BURK|nr:hypothetical protein [Paraburkholderia caffeinitolerans]CAB3803881.1 hypothetical protein LMG28688_05860 [Paraburkholderia caffeinitolerans]